MAEERIYISNGVAIQKRGNVWWIDLYSKGVRFRKPIGSKPDAVRVGAAMIAKPLNVWCRNGECPCQFEDDEHKVIEAHVGELAKFGHRLTRMAEEHPEEAENARVAGKRVSLLIGNANQVPPSNSADEVFLTRVLDNVKQAMGARTVSPAPAPLRKVLADLLRDMRREELDREYIKTAKRQVKLFITRSGVRTIGEVTKDHVVSHQVHLGSLKLSTKSKKTYFDFVLEYLRFAVEGGHLEAIPYVPPRKRRKKGAGRPPVRFFRHSEVQRILSAEAEPDLQALIATAVYAGLDRDELFQLDWQNVDLRRQAINVLRGKIDTYLELPVFDQLRPYFLRFEKRSGRVFSRWVDIDTMGKDVRQLVSSAIGENLGLREARHTYCTWVQANGVSAFVAAQWAGHTVQVQQARYSGRIGLDRDPLVMSWDGHRLVSSGLPPVPRDASSQA